MNRRDACEPLLQPNTIAPELVIEALPFLA
jgi:hypothetical protein